MCTSWMKHVHVHHVNLKISKEIGILCRLMEHVSRHMLWLFYYTCTTTYDYGLINWGCASTKIRKNVKNVIRLISEKMIVMLSLYLNDCIYYTLTNFINFDKLLYFDKFYELTIAKFKRNVSNEMLPVRIISLFSRAIR